MPAGGGTLDLVADSLALARRAAEYGWIRAEAVAAVAAEVERDRQRPDPLEELIPRPPPSA